MKVVTILLGVAVVFIVLARVFPIMWPMVTEASGNVTAMTGTDPGTTMFKSFWEIVLLVGGVGCAIGAIVYGWRMFKAQSGGIG